ncbi:MULTISPECIES: DUF1707 domain-containing protein [unclassified Crossiella]|uniref:DUF1707 SHOCT-like domain-containing protein n=1 Tax=unclassified Crossiella TaxID=2620835 RepID=UPI001FFF12A3|nr:MULTISPECIES: DUF1707 domain-containing protein [unclassified Crossiella]MCK2238351.1 DUF1707 domain-containing protein [Crossiella sp. S99.2]MCK2256391.1 DUF1707 domain-containing protein [Crossiella sp. S99.1]
MPDNEPELRISDTERSAALSALGEHFAVGRLQLTEYDQRAGKVAASMTRGELRELFADLPEPHPRFDGVPATAAVAKIEGGGEVAVPTDPRTPAQRAAAVSLVVLGAAWIPLLIFLGWWWWIFVLMGVGAVYGSLWGEDWNGGQGSKKRKKKRK